MLFIFVLVAALLILAPVSTASDCKSEIFCTGSLLRSVQSLKIYEDDKTFVDRVITPATTEEEVRRLWGEFPPEDRQNAQMVKAFVEKWTLGPGADIEPVEPVDWAENPAFLANVPTILREFGKDLHARWKTLLRQPKPTIPHNHSSLLPLPHPFVVAGGRFRESYNWDSYWIQQGLVVSNMPETTKNMILNHLFLIKTYGYVPNGARQYYLNRSQPPLLALSVWDYYQRFGDVDLLQTALPTLVQEYEYWMSAQHAVVITDAQGIAHTLNRYNVENSTPRPESWLKDYQLAQTAFKTDQERAIFYKHIASAAESGWDFSSRWLKDFTNLETIRTADIVPVDLNAILFRYETALALIARQLGDNTQYERFIAAKQSRGVAIFKLLWNAQHSTWFDLDLKQNKQIILGPAATNPEPVHFLSQYTPIWSGASHLSMDDNREILKAMVHSNIKPGGLPTSNQNIPQQWDGDNAWAPLHYFISEGLDGGGEQRDNYPQTSVGAVVDEQQQQQQQQQPKRQGPTPQTHPELFQIVNTWVSATFCSWKSSPDKPIYEKYDAMNLGKPGNGGEYSVQTGFGWTNGLVLHYLERYGPYITPFECPK